MTTLRHAEATMTPAEAEAIVARLAARDETGVLSVVEVAEALRLSPDEVARLLAEVRASPLVAMRPKRRTLRRERRVWLLSGGLALILATVIAFSVAPPAGGPFARRHRPVSAGQYDLVLDGQGIGTAFAGGADPHTLAQGIDPILNEQETRHRGNNPIASIEEAENALLAAREGRWRDVPSLRFARLEIDRPDEMGHRMRWADALVPVYSGNDAHIVDLVRTERARRVAAALEAARGDVSTTKTPEAPPASP